MAVTLPCAPSASAAVRHELSQLDELDWILGDVMLVASELVNNAVVHSGGTEQHDIQVRALRRGSRLTLSVRDPGISGRSAGARPPTDGQPGGWGLHLVAALSEQWGEERRDGYCVWADIRLPTGSDAEMSQ